MVRILASTLVLAAALACGHAADRAGRPLVAKGDGVALTVDDLKARIEAQSPMVRPAFAQMDAKRMLVDNLLKVELLAHAAEKEGLANDPEVRFAIRNVLAAKYQQRFLLDPERQKSAIPDADVARYYAEHPDEFHQPLRVHAAHLLVVAPASGPERAKKLAEARRLLRKVLAEEKGNRSAFALLASQSSEDPETKGRGGDLMYRSRDALEKDLGREFAEVAFSLGDDETASRVLETARGFELVHVYGRAEPVDQTLEQARGEITRSLLGGWKVRAFEELVKRLREEAGVVVDEAALQGVMPEDVKLGASAPPAVREASASGAPAAPTPAGR